LHCSEDQIFSQAREIQDLQDSVRELREDVERLQPSSGNFVEGIAIFTDVEERRIALEKELISMKVWANSYLLHLNSQF
jgi:hypothetical protein